MVVGAMLLRLPLPAPTLQTLRLALVPYSEGDARWVSDLAGALDVARFTGLPHPMDEPIARQWVGRHIAGFENGQSLGFGARLDGEEGTPVGGGSVRLRPESGIVSIGFWLGHDFWGRGLGGELCGALVRFAFDTLGARRLEADCADANEASARILLGCGFEREGCLRDGFHRFDATHDLLVFGALRPPQGDGR